MKAQSVLSPDAPMMQALTHGVCQLKRENFRGWVTEYGTPCLFHGRLLSTLPTSEAEMIRRILASNKEELEAQLQDFAVKVRCGERVAAESWVISPSSSCRKGAQLARRQSAEHWTS
jgi:hypothetical protein